ncbi:MAG: hypothetical protein AAF799_12295 [Myxococcota bacterium]
MAYRWIVVGLGLVCGGGCGSSAPPLDSGGSGGTESDTGDPGATLADETGDDDGDAEPGPPRPVCQLESSWHETAPMVAPQVSPALIGWPEGGVLATGGHGDTCDSLDEVPTAAVQHYDPTTDTWSAMPELLGPRVRHAVVDVEGVIMVLGGFDGRGSALATTERLDPVADAWVAGTPLPLAIEHPVALAIDARVLVIGRSVDDGYVAFRSSDGGESWQPAASAHSFAARLLPWADTMILVGTSVGTRAKIYDWSADAWEDAPPDVVPHSQWDTGASNVLNASALIDTDQLFVLGTTGGSHPEIGQQGYAALLEPPSKAWVGGAEGPFLGDSNFATGIGFAPGWVLVHRGSDWTWADVYSRDDDAWCGTASNESPLRRHRGIALGDGAVLFAGGRQVDSNCASDRAFVWTPMLETTSE